MSLRYRGLLWRSLVFETDIIGLPLYIWNYEEEKIRVTNDGELVFRYNGGNKFELNRTVFNSTLEKKKGIFGTNEKISSNDLSITLNRSINKAPETSIFFPKANEFIGLNARNYVEITCSRSHQEQYLLSIKKHSWGTNAVIESMTEFHDSQIMIACLAYLWTATENSRRPW